MQLYSSRNTETGSPYKQFFIDRYQEAYKIQFEIFAQNIRDGGNFPVGIEDGYRALLLAETANRSLAENRPVKVSEVEKD